jgi:hypothetical protein
LTERARLAWQIGRTKFFFVRPIYFYVKVFGSAELRFATVAGQARNDTAGKHITYDF